MDAHDRIPLKTPEVIPFMAMVTSHSLIIGSAVFAVLLLAGILFPSASRALWFDFLVSLAVSEPNNFAKTRKPFASCWSSRCWQNCYTVTGDSTMRLLE